MSFEPTDTDTLRNSSGNIPEHKRGKPGTNGDRSQDDAPPDVGTSASQSPHSIDSDPDEAPHLMTSVQEEVPYRLHRISSGKRKKAQSTSHPQIRSENNPVTIRNW